MMTISLSAARAVARRKLPGYLEDLERSAALIDGDTVAISEEHYQRIRSTYSPDERRRVELPVLTCSCTIERRNSVCVGPPRCDHASHVEEGRVRYCDKCGCGGMQARIALQDWHCPINKC